MVESPKQPKRSVLIAARLISLLIGLAGAEGILWFGGYPGWWQTLQISRDDSEYAPDPQLGWKNREGQFDMVDPERNTPFRYTNWSEGRRATADHESALNPENAASAPRVLFFGDSYVQGYGLSNQQTFAWIVQKNHPELAISNFGTADYGTYQSYLAIRLAIAKYARGPCSVFYLFNTFHEGRNVAEPDWVRVVKQPPPGLFFPYADLADGALRARQSPGEMVWPVSRWLRTAALAEDYYRRASILTAHAEQAQGDGNHTRDDEPDRAGCRWTVHGHLLRYDARPAPGLPRVCQIARHPFHRLRPSADDR